MIVHDQIVTLPLDQNDAEERASARIAAHTANTWQPQRSAKEKRRDTRLGKLAEDALARYLLRVGIPYRSWDELRSDGFRKHAPLDGFLAHPTARNRLESDGFGVAANVAQQGAHFQPGLLQACESGQLFGVEVKATRIRSRHRRAGVVDFEKILRDDFLFYPPIRHGELTAELMTKLGLPEQRAEAAQRAPYFLVRVYVDQNGDLPCAYLIGYTTRPEFFDSDLMTVKSMLRTGKSEQAVYYALGLCHGHAMRTLALRLHKMVNG